MPRGPFPLPVLGNALLFRNSKVHSIIVLTELHKTYGPVYTIWLGWQPVVVIGDLALLKTAFNSRHNELMGRPDMGAIKLYVDKCTNVGFSDYSEDWAHLRRVAHTALRKLAYSDKFGHVTNDIVANMVRDMDDENPVGTAFNPTKYLAATVSNIITSTSFNKRYEWNDPELRLYHNTLDTLNNKTNILYAIDKVPALKLYPPYRRLQDEAYGMIVEMKTSLKGHYTRALAVHRPGVCEHYADALIEAKQAALAHKLDSVSALNDDNLSMLMGDLLVSGFETTHYSLLWLLLLMANNRQMQIRLRDEIESVIGDRMATHEDRNRCHYVNAFIAETLRYRPVAPGGVPHTAMCDTHLDKHWLPKGTVIVGNLLANSMDANLWSNPHTFDPDRFLNQDGTLVAHVPGYVAFGVGHRSCLGEKLATAELFLVVAHLIKYTAGRVFALETGKGDGSADLEMAADQLVTSRPKPYKIMLLPCA